MNYSNYKITLDVRETSSQLYLSTKQGDTMRRLIVTLTEGGRPYKIEDNVTAVFTAEKADKNIIFNDCRIEEGAIVYDFTAQTTAAVGRMPCEIRLYAEDNKLLTSARFTIAVEEAVYSDGKVVESVTEVNTLTRLITEAVDLIAAAEDGRFIPKISIGTVTTLPAGSNATASFTGDFREPVLNLGIPQGPEGQAESLIPDTELSLGSTKPVQNKVIAKAINDALEAMEKKADTKVDKVSGKGLSTNDFTNEDKAKLDGVEAGANNYVLADKGVTPNKLDRPYLSLGLRTVIASGDDLNNYTNVGCYAASTNAIAETVLNSPTTEAFMLTVYNAQGREFTGAPDSAQYRYYFQELVTLSGQKWVRRLHYLGSTTVTAYAWERILTTDDVQTYTATIPVSGWTMENAAAGIYKQTVTVTGLLATDSPIVDIDMMADSAAFEVKLSRLEAWANVYSAWATTNAINIRMSELPTIDIPIKMVVIRK